MSNKNINIIMAGTGGQGIVLASRIVAQVAFKSDLDVKESELHGMAQRGGSVLGYIRFGKRIYSPIIPKGMADILVALEEMESIRYLPFLKPSGIIILNKKKITPAMTDESKYPQNIENFLREKKYSLFTLEAEKIAKNLGAPKVENSVILGFLSVFLTFSEKLWLEVIKNNTPPKMINYNIEAFKEGRRLAKENGVLEQGIRNIKKSKIKATST